MGVFVKSLEQIVRDVILTIEKSKIQIMDIYENTLSNITELEEKNQELKEALVDIIAQVDAKTREEKRSRQELMFVSKDLKKYNEEDIRKVYYKTTHVQSDLAILKNKEEEYRSRRDITERQIRKLMDMLKKAEKLTTQIGVASNFLSTQMLDLISDMATNEKKQMFSPYIIKAQEDERMRLAREIHDGSAQTMASIVLKVELIERLLESNPKRAAEELAELKNAAKFALKEVRKIIFDLRPMSIDDIGLPNTLRNYFAVVKEQTNLFGALQVIGEEENLESNVALTVFRVLQEGINNIHRHAKTNAFQIKLDFGISKYLSVTLIDRGKGFNVNKKRRANSFGIVGMEERIAIIGGDISIESSEGKGTTVTMKVPYSITDTDEHE